MIVDETVGYIYNIPKLPQVFLLLEHHKKLQKPPKNVVTKIRQKQEGFSNNLNKPGTILQSTLRK